MAFANDTIVLTPDGDKKISTIKVDNKVQARLDDESWETRTVDFSAGTLAKTTAITILFGNQQEVIVTPNQLFLVSEELLKAAKDLEITDTLMDQSGAAVKILQISTGKYAGGIHSIALYEHPTANTDGHLILCNGVVAGAYELEMGYRVDL
jgi:hypothetical protein